MSGEGATGGREGAFLAGEAAIERGDRIAIVDITFHSAHGLLKGCDGEDTWNDAGKPCRAPEWTTAGKLPISHSMGEKVDITIRLRGAAPPDGTIDILGKGPVRFALTGVPWRRGGASVRMTSSRPLPKRVARVALELSWSVDDTAPSPAETENVMYVTMDRPLVDQEGTTQEDGVTVKRMDRAVSWVEPLRSLHPHSIVRALMGKFPYYSLKPSTKVPRMYHHPTYFNDAGGAWAMSDYVEETGECQAIVRLCRAILRQLGVPGEARTLIVWADPEIEGGKKAVTAYWDENPGAGLDRTKVVRGERWLATLVDAAVTVGKTYPASHTIVNGKTSPGFNRYEACLEFTYNGDTRQYGGGAGVFQSKESVLSAFWGLAWVTEAPNDGFKVEEVVTRYR